tara:strand:+ start:780 stop:941 length:162 start_codon:yes stop_codon:yes gene_type:complete
MKYFLLSLIIVSIIFFIRVIYPFFKKISSKKNTKNDIIDMEKNPDTDEYTPKE